MAESMPKSAQEPELPEITGEDIESLMAKFQEQDAEGSEEDRKRRAEAIENLIAEGIAEHDQKQKEQHVERTGIVYAEAAKAADAVMKDQLTMAMQMADVPEGATILLQPVQEHLQKTLDPGGGFGKLHTDERIQKLYAVYTDKLRHEAVVAVRTALEKRLETAEDPGEISRLHKLLENVESADPGGDKE